MSTIRWVEHVGKVDGTDWIERSKNEVGGLVDVPAGESGDWRVSHMVLDEDASIATMFQFKDRMVPPGKYTRLVEGSTTYMSDTPSEIVDHIPLMNAVSRSNGGRILVFGLGIGMVMEMLMEMHQRGIVVLESVTFVENSPDVIALVAPHYRLKYPEHFNVIEADALKLTPEGKHYDAIWFDIWATPSHEDGDDAQALMDTWSDNCDWMGVWAAEHILATEEEEVINWWNA